MRKKQKNPYPRSFYKRLTRRIMLTMLIVMGLVTVWIFFAGSSLVDAGVEIIAQRYLKSENQKIRSVLSDVYVASVNVVQLIEDNLDNPDRLYGVMEYMVKLNPRIRSCGISFIDSYYPKKGRWFCPYAQRSDSDSIETTTLGSEQYDYLHASWFLRVLASDEGIWSKPYMDGVNQKTPLVSWLQPVHDKQGKTVAILGADVSLESLKDDVKVPIENEEEEVWNPEFKLYTFVIDSAGTYVIHPDYKRLVNENYFTYAEATADTTDNYIGRQMIAGKTVAFVSDDSEHQIEGQSVDVFIMPVKHTSWSLACVIPSIMVNIVGYIIGGVLISMIIIGLLVVYFVGRRFIKKTVEPLKLLSVSADEVAKGNFDTQLPVIKSNDELHQLRDSFEKMEHSLTNYINELKTTTAQKAAIESELKIAHDIQMSMLPKTFPPYPDCEDIIIYGTLTPAKEVGGDLFDFYIRDGQLFFCIGDVSGKGVPAALVMAVMRSLFRNVSTHESAPSVIMGALNDAMTENNDANMFVTFFVGVLNLETGHLYYCNAGHDAPLLISSGVSLLNCDSNLPIGVIPGYKFSLQETTLAPQDTLFLYTDGLNEAENFAHAQFGEQRIIDVAASLAAEDQKRPSVLVNTMVEAVHSFVGEAEQSDDLTMLAIHYDKKS